MAERTREETVNFAPGPAQLPTEVRSSLMHGVSVSDSNHRLPEVATQACGQGY